MDDQEFRIKMHDFLISKNGILFDWGTNMDANRVIIERLEKKIKKHPILWKLFFMVA